MQEASYMYQSYQTNILAIIQGTTKQYGAKKLANRLNIKLQTLYADVDPKSIGRRANKLGFLDWLVILEESGDLASLDEVNRLFGRACLPIPTPPTEMCGACWMEHCANAAKEAGEAVSEMARSILDGRMDRAELKRCEKEFWDAILAFTGPYLAIQNSITNYK